MKCVVRWKCPPLERTCRARAGGAPLWRRRRKKCTGGGALSGSGHGCFAPRGHTPAHVFRRGGATNYIGITCDFGVQSHETMIVQSRDI